MLENFLLEIGQMGQSLKGHPGWISLVLIFFMFFITVLVNGWPDFHRGENEDAPDMDFESMGFPEPTNEPSVDHEDYSLEWKQTGLELGDNGFPSKIIGIVTLRRR